MICQFMSYYIINDDIGVVSFDEKTDILFS